MKDPKNTQDHAMRTMLKKGTQSVEVFRTNVTSESEADNVLIMLRDAFPQMKINFDLDDCDKILRVAGDEILPEYISAIVCQLGFECDQLN